MVIDLVQFPSTFRAIFMNIKLFCYILLEKLPNSETQRVDRKNTSTCKHDGNLICLTLTAELSMYCKARPILSESNGWEACLPYNEGS